MIAILVHTTFDLMHLDTRVSLVQSATTFSQVEFCMNNGLNVMLAISPKRSDPYSTFKLEQEAFRQLSVVAPRVTDW